MVLPSTKLSTAVGKIQCPNCHNLGTVKPKAIKRKTKIYYALYVYHYDPLTKKVRWCYYGKRKR